MSVMSDSDVIERLILRVARAEGVSPDVVRLSVGITVTHSDR